MNSMKLKDFENRIRSKKSMIEFFSNKMDQYFPNLAVFNTNFLRCVLKGSKKLLPMSAAKAPILYQMKDIKEYDKSYLLQIVKTDSVMCSYIPDHASDKNMERDILLSVS